MITIWYAYIYDLQIWNTYSSMTEWIIDNICGLNILEEIMFRSVKALPVYTRRLLLVSMEDIDQFLSGLATSS